MKKFSRITADWLMNPMECPQPVPFDDLEKETLIEILLAYHAFDKAIMEARQDFENAITVILSK